MKKVVSFFLAFVLTLTTVSVVDVNAQELNWNGFIYQIYNDVAANNKYIIIKDYIGTEQSITFPEKIDGLPVRELSDKFTCTANIISVKIMDTMLQPEGLAWCETLEKIIVDESSKRYKVIDGILYDRKVQTLICYPRGKKNREYVVPRTVVATVGFREMFDAGVVKSITFTGIVPYCGNTRIEKVKIAGKITEIPDNAFENCKKLQTVEMGKKIRFVGERAFFNCIALKRVSLSKALKGIMGRAFENTSLTSIRLPYGLQKIRHYAFCKTKIKKVVIPQSVTYVGYDAFPQKTKISKASYLKKVVNPSRPSQYAYKAYATIKSKLGTKKYRAWEITKITTPKKNVKLKKGENYIIKTWIYIFRNKKNGDIKSDILKFTSSNSNVAKVTHNGKIKALKKGVATITVSMRTSLRKYKMKVRVS